MTTDSKLRTFASDIEMGCAGFSYPRRIDIERTFFKIAKELAHASLDIELHNFQIASRDAVVARADFATSSGRKAEYEVVLETFQLAAALASLASGEPYRTWELAGPGLASRDGAMRHFARRLRRLADRLGSLETLQKIPEGATPSFPG